MIRGRSLARRLALIISMGFLVIWTLATLAMALVLKSEQEELLNLTLQETAQLFQPVLSEWKTQGRVTVSGDALNVIDTDEALVYLLLDISGNVLLRSVSAADADLPPNPPVAGLTTTSSHTFYITAPDSLGHIALFGDPNEERWEAYRDSLLAFLLPMLALLLPMYLLVGWSARVALKPLDMMRTQIEARDEARLDPIATTDLPDEMREMTKTLNSLMARLGQAIEGERAFATNAAHELRTPVAIALAQIQRLKASPADSADRIARIELALHRMSSLVSRLLQLARADAGIGANANPQDLRILLDLVIEDSRRDPTRADRMSITLPEGPIWGRIDADAFAILAGNLIDNAFQHTSAETKVYISLSLDAELLVENEAAVLSADQLANLTHRFDRGGLNRSGFGLGLHIANRIAIQSGGSLTLRSSGTDERGMFSANFRARDDEAD